MRSLPGFALSLAITAAAFTQPVLAKDIVDIAAGNSNLSTLVTAVKAAGLVDTLKSDGPFTVFAPTNEAFAALPKATLKSLLEPKNKKKLAAILTYHVVSGKVRAASLAGKRKSVETVEGSTIHIDGRHGVKVNGAHVIKADIEASNGVVHVIDHVLLPK